MDLRSPHVMRMATFAVFGLAAIVGAYQCTRLTDGSGRDEVELKAGELSVRESVGRLKPVTVRGYLFNDFPNGFRLCDKRDSGDPPKCVGPFVTLDPTFDHNRFNLKTGKDAEGVKVVWAEDPVVVSGRLDGGLFLKVDRVGG